MPTSDESGALHGPSDSVASLVATAEASLHMSALNIGSLPPTPSPAAAHSFPSLGSPEPTTPSRRVSGAVAVDSPVSRASAGFAPPQFVPGGSAFLPDEDLEDGVMRSASGDSAKPLLPPLERVSVRHRATAETKKLD